MRSKNSFFTVTVNANKSSLFKFCGCVDIKPDFNPWIWLSMGNLLGFYGPTPSHVKDIQSKYANIHVSLTSNTEVQNKILK